MSDLRCDVMYVVVECNECQHDTSAYRSMQSELKLSQHKVNSATKNSIVMSPEA